MCSLLAPSHLLLFYDTLSRPRTKRGSPPISFQGGFRGLTDGRPKRFERTLALKTRLKGLLGDMG